MAEEIFDVWTLSWIGTLDDSEKNRYDLNESEILTLHLLTKCDSLSVGELQQSIGVSPTKMSRVLRSLQREGVKPLIQRQFNPEDRRKVDVSITHVGRKAHETYRSAKLANLIRVLAEMQEPDREDFVRLVQIIREKLTRAIIPEQIAPSDAPR
jgi:DNA-binding MarR family transcriptional regulator